MTVDARRRRNALGQFPTGITTVTSGGDPDIFVGRVFEFHKSMAKRGHSLAFAGGRDRQFAAGAADMPPITGASGANAAPSL